MKNKVLIVIAVLFFTNCSEEQSIDDREKRNENWCWFVDEKTNIGRWVPIQDENPVQNGTYTLFFGDGTIFEHGKIRNGEVYDTVYGYNALGKLIYKDIVENNQTLETFFPDGKFLSHYHPTGEVLEEFEVLNNKQVGISKKYYKNGEVSNLSIPRNDSTWTFLEYTESGQVIDSATEVNEKNYGIRKLWYPNGKLKTIIAYESGMKNGICKWFHPNGQLSIVARYKNDKENGHVIHYYESGNKKSEVDFLDGQYEGTMYEYFQNGGIKSKTNYLNGKTEGEQSYYHPNGQLKTFTLIINDSLVTYSLFDEEGQSIEYSDLKKEDKK